MFDLFLILAPLLILPIVALLRFIGCAIAESGLAPSLQSVSVSPNPVVGGNNVSVTVTLTGPAPNAIPMTLTGSNQTAFPNASVTVSAGQASQTVSAPTKPVPTSTPVIITSSYDPSVSTTLTVNPAVTPAIGLVDHTLSPSPNATNTTSAIDTTGATLIVIAVEEYFVTFNAPIDSAGNTWTRLAQNANWAWYYSLNPKTSASHTFSINGGGGTQTGIAVAAFSGVTALDTSVDSTSSYQPGTITPSGNGELLVTTFISYTNSSNPAQVDSGFIVLDQPIYPAGVVLAYFVQPTAAAINPLWSGIVDEGYGRLVGMAAFK